MSKQPYQGQPVPPPRWCAFCGAMTKPNAAFCNKCGQPIQPVSQLQRQQVQPPAKKSGAKVKIALITTVGTVLVAIISGVFALVHPFSPPGPTPITPSNSHSASNNGNGNTANNGNGNMTNNGSMTIVFSQNVPAPTARPTAAPASTGANVTNPYAQDMQTFRFNASLEDNTNPNVKWEESDITGNTGRNICAFYNGYYHAYDQDPRNASYTDCEAQQSNFTDFTYEVQMIIVQGNAGGVFIRSQDSQSPQFSYLFLIRSDGLCGLYAVLNTASGPYFKGLVGGTITHFNRGSGANTIAIVARGDQIDIYVNQIGIASVVDSTYRQGGVGVIGWTNSDVVFRNAKLWTA
jgi:hypothetical protein